MNATLDLDAPMDLAELAAHYATQLERAGWTRNTEEQSGPIVLNTWTFRDEDDQPTILDSQSKIANWLHNKLLEHANDLRTQNRASQDKEVGR